MRSSARAISQLLTPTVLLGLAVLVLATWPIAVWVRRRWWASQPLIRVWLAVGALAVVLPVTLFRDGLALGWHPGRLLDWGTSTLDAISHGHWLDDSQVFLNIVLGVPAGLFCTWLTRRPWWTLAGVAAYFLLIECIQALFGAGANDIGDVVANSLGAALGVGLAALALRVLGERAATTGRWWHVPLVLAVALAAGLFVARLAADSHQREVRHQLGQELAGVNLDDVVRSSEAGEMEELWNAGEERADGQRSAEGRWELRFPASSFGFQRCVFAVWTADGLALRDASGSECTRFIDSDLLVDGEWVGL